MNHHDRYREHRIRTSLQGHLGQSPADERVIDALAARAYREGRGVYFTADHLAAMPWDVRALIDAQARKLYGSRQT